ncbi:ashwin-like [Diadema setosum]|uniref:ashwin-like n=1 Tax=Diadema setosum TaxID=31175 RepID=UPI003B3AA964
MPSVFSSIMNLRGVAGGVGMAVEGGSSLDLLQPELLSVDTLVDILEERCIRLDASQKEDKETLVEIFLRTVTPKPQRRPRENRRGQLTAKVIEKLDAVRARQMPRRGVTDSKQSSGNAIKRDRKGGLLISTNLDSSQDGISRLKPPPVVINKSKSVVKLNQGKSSDSNRDTPKSPTGNLKIRKLVSGQSSSSSSPSSLSSSPLSPSSSTLKLVRSPTGSKPDGTSPRSGDKPILRPSKSPTVESPSSVKKISLKRKSTENGEDVTDVSEGASHKKKIKKITWP